MGMLFSAFSFRLFAKMPLRQIIRGSDYSRSINNYSDYVCQFQEKSFEKNFLRRKRRIRKKKKSLVRPFPGSKSRDTI